MQGSFAFVLFDRLTKRVWAARDAGGVQPLYWGVTGAHARRPWLSCRVLQLPEALLPRCCPRTAAPPLTPNPHQPHHATAAEDSRLVFGTDLNKLEGCVPSATPFPAGTLYASHDATLCHSPGAPAGAACRRAGAEAPRILAACPRPNQRPPARPHCPPAGTRGWVIKGEHPLPGDLLSFVRRSSPTATHHWRGVKAVPRMDAEGCVPRAAGRLAGCLAAAGGRKPVPTACRIPLLRLAPVSRHIRGAVYRVESEHQIGAAE